MTRSLDPVRARAAHRRLGVALGASTLVHVALAALWLAVDARAPRPLPIVEYEVSRVVAVDVAVTPDEEIRRDAPEDAAGAPSGGGAAVPPAPPPEGAAASVQPPATVQAPPVAMGRTGVARPSAPVVASPVVASPHAAVAPPAPGAPMSAPPGVPGGTGTTPGGAPAGRGAGSGGGTGGAGGDGAGSGAGRLVERPEQSPRVDRIALPSYPDEARRAGVGARARVRVLVGPSGEVVRVEVVERTLVERRGRERGVASLPFGMEAAVVEAAERSRFRAARDGGDAVRAYAVITLSVGTDV